MVWNVIRQAAHIPVPNPLRWYPFPQHLRRPPGAGEEKKQKAQRLPKKGRNFGGVKVSSYKKMKNDRFRSECVNQLVINLKINCWASWNDFSFISCPLPPPCARGTCSCFAFLMILAKSVQNPAILVCFLSNVVLVCCLSNAAMPLPIAQGCLL